MNLCLTDLLCIPSWQWQRFLHLLKLFAIVCCVLVLRITWAHCTHCRQRRLWNTTMRVAFHGHGNMANRETNGQTGQTSVWAKFIVSWFRFLCGPSCSCAIAPREQCNPRNATARTIHPLTYFYLERWFNALFSRALKEARSYPALLLSSSLSLCV